MIDPTPTPDVGSYSAFHAELEALRAMTAERKLRVMRSLIRQAFALKAAGVRSRNPELGEEEIWARARDLVSGGDRDGP